MSLYWNKVHLSASAEWPLSLGCSEMIFCMLQNSHVEDMKIYLAECPLLQQHECSECHCHSPVVNDAVGWQGESKRRFLSSASETKAFFVFVSI